MLQFEILVIKLEPIYRFSSRAIEFSKVSSLSHEISDNPMEKSALVRHGGPCELARSLISLTQGNEVFDSFGNCVAKKAKDYSPLVDAINLDIKVALVSYLINGLDSLFEPSYLVERLRVLKVNGSNDQQDQHATNCDNSHRHERRHSQRSFFLPPPVLDLGNCVFRKIYLLLQPLLFRHLQSLFFLFFINFFILQIGKFIFEG